MSNLFFNSSPLAPVAHPHGPMRRKWVHLVPQGPPVGTRHSHQWNLWMSKTEVAPWSSGGDYRRMNLQPNLWISPNLRTTGRALHTCLANWRTLLNIRRSLRTSKGRMSLTDEKRNSHYRGRWHNPEILAEVCCESRVQVCVDVADLVSNIAVLVLVSGDDCVVDYSPSRWVTVSYAI